MIRERSLLGTYHLLSPAAFASPVLRLLSSARVVFICWVDVMADRLALRFLESEEDLLVIEEMAKKVHFNLGIHDRRLQWQYSSKTHMLLLDKTTRAVVGYVTGNFISKDLYLRAHVYIDKNYRTAHTLMDLLPIWNAMVGLSPDTNVIYNCNAITLKAVVRSQPGFVINEKMLSYEGTVDHPILRQFEPPSDITVRLIKDAEDLEKLLTYDKMIHSMGDRERFMRSWCTNDGVNDTTAIALSSSGTCVGFASLRRAINLIEPAYAESDAIGLALLRTVLLTLPEKDIAQITYPGSQRSMLSFCAALGWTSCMTEHRVYSFESIPLPLKKVFAVQDFFAI